MAQNSHGGRASSWLAVSVMWIGFIVGGVAFVPHLRWWLFWIGVGIVAVGGIIAAAVRIFDDVIMDGTREMDEERHHSELTGGRGSAGGPEIATDPATTRPHG
jgi:hypothetical protein